MQKNPLRNELLQNQRRHIVHLCKFLTSKGAKSDVAVFLFCFIKCNVLCWRNKYLMEKGSLDSKCNLLIFPFRLEARLLSSSMLLQQRTVILFVQKVHVYCAQYLSAAFKLSNCLIQFFFGKQQLLHNCTTSMRKNHVSGIKSQVIDHLMEAFPSKTSIIWAFHITCPDWHSGSPSFCHSHLIFVCWLQSKSHANVVILFSYFKNL